MAARLPLRLLDLPQAVLVKMAAKAFVRSLEIWAEAEAALAIHKPVPALVTEVLLSPDLLPLVMAALPVASKSAALVCSTWCDAWQTTAQLRGLCPAELPQPDVAITCAAVVTQLSDERLCITHARFQPVLPGGEPWRHTVVDSAMRKLYDLQVVQRRIAMATPNTLYAWTQDENLLHLYQVSDDGSSFEVRKLSCGLVPLAAAPRPTLPPRRIVFRVAACVAACLRHCPTTPSRIAALAARATARASPPRSNTHCISALPLRIAARLSVCPHHRPPRRPPCHPPRRPPRRSCTARLCIHAAGPKRRSSPW